MRISSSLTDEPDKGGQRADSKEKKESLVAGQDLNIQMSWSRKD